MAKTVCTARNLDVQNDQKSQELPTRTLRQTEWSKKPNVASTGEANLAEAEPPSASHAPETSSTAKNSPSTPGEESKRISTATKSTKKRKDSAQEKTDSPATVESHGRFGVETSAGAEPKRSWKTSTTTKGPSWLKSEASTVSIPSHHSRIIFTRSSRKLSTSLDSSNRESERKAPTMSALKTTRSPLKAWFAQIVHSMKDRARVR